MRNRSDRSQQPDFEWSKGDRLLYVNGDQTSKGVVILVEGSRGDSSYRVTIRWDSTGHATGYGPQIEWLHRPDRAGLMFHYDGREP